MGGGTGNLDPAVEGSYYEEYVGNFVYNGTTYRRFIRYISCGKMPNATTKLLDLGIDYYKILSIKGTCSFYNGSLAYVQPIPYDNGLTSTSRRLFTLMITTDTSTSGNPKQISITAINNMSNYDATAIIEYIK